MEKELGLESDMKISVYNEVSGGLLSGKKELIIGECSVAIPSLQTKCDKPQFYNLINEEGMFVGQVLANFHVKFYPPQQHQKKGGKQTNDNKEHNELLEMFKQTTLPKYKVDIAFSLFGMRNLINKAVKPRVDIKLTNQKETQTLRLADGQEFHANNPNFGQCVHFNNVSLEKEPLFWPFLEI